MVRRPVYPYGDIGGRYLKHLKEKVRETVSFLTSKTDRPPKTGVITGTGLSDAVGPLDDALTLVTVISRIFLSQPLSVIPVD
jgi:hypothetical protein